MRLQAPERPRLLVRADMFPIDKAVSPARTAGLSQISVITVELSEGSCRGRGECLPDSSQGETIDSVIETIRHIAPNIETGMVGRRRLQRVLPAGAARNALDCALWDFGAKRGGSSVWQIAGFDIPRRLVTAFTIPQGSPAEMAAAALAETHRPLLKLELGGADAAQDLARVQAVRQALRKARLILDVQGGWTAEQLRAWLPALAAAEVELIKQPLPVGSDEALTGLPRSVPICADASCRTREDLDDLAGRYNAIDIKLDKTGGLTEALALSEAAHELNFKIIISSRFATSLGAAPAALLGQEADWVDLDAPLLLARDRQPGLRFDGSMLYPPNTSLWG